MADIKIGGKLRNIQDIKGTIADASQISFNETDIATELELLKKNVSSQLKGVSEAISKMAVEINQEENAFFTRKSPF